MENNQKIVPVEIEAPKDAMALALEEQDADRSQRSKLVASSELLFVVVPFIVIALTLGHRGQLKTIFYIPEWSLVSSVILGQSLMRIVSVSVGRTNVVREGIVFLLTLLLVLGLIPALSILVFVLTSDAVSTKLAWTQALMFLASASVFWISVTLESQLRMEEEQHRPS